MLKGMAKKPIKPESRPVGRPSDYRPEYCDKIIEFMGDGSSLTAFAASLGTHRDTIHEWAKVHPEFSDSKKAAEAVSEEWWERQGKNGLINKYQGDNINSAVWIFTMKARFKWRDTDNQSIKIAQGPEGQAIEISDVKGPWKLKDPS